MSIDRWMDKEDVVHTYNGALLGHKKEWNNTICSNMDGPRDYHTKRSKSEKGKYHIVPLIISVQSLSSVQLFAAPRTAAHQASCPSPTPGACSNSCPSSQWCHPTILSSVVPFSSCLQSFPASGSFPMSQFFTSGGQSTTTYMWKLKYNINELIYKTNIKT